MSTVFFDQFKGFLKILESLLSFLLFKKDNSHVIKAHCSFFLSYFSRNPVASDCLSVLVQVVVVGSNFKVDVGHFNRIIPIKPFTVEEKDL